LTGRAGGRTHALAGQLLALGRRSIDTVHGGFELSVGLNVATGQHAFALARGDVTTPEPLLARLHSSCVTSETFGGCDCDCVEQLDGALERIARAGRGAVFYLVQEGRGAGFTAKARDRMLVQASGDRMTTFEAYASMGLDADQRSYEEVRWLCRLLDVRAPLRLLTNNPEKIAALRAATGLDLDGAEPLSPAASPYALHYIASKMRSGHRLAEPEASSVAGLPEPVVGFDPYELADEPRFVHVADYLLPVLSRAASGVEPAPDRAALWFRVHAHVDLVTRTELALLGFGPPDAPEVLVRLQFESLLERFPLAGGGLRKRLWHAAARRIAEHGAGLAAFVPSAGFAAGLVERDGDAEASIVLLRHRLRGRSVRLLVAPRERGIAEATSRMLERGGVRVVGREMLDVEVDTAPPSEAPVFAGRAV
jgi:GTP cyclohydrolase II